MTTGLNLWKRLHTMHKQLQASMVSMTDKYTTSRAMATVVYG